ncbi:hypothetical protein OAA64_00640 [bacterium]|nr:hypothetical protein [bacterium]
MLYWGCDGIPIFFVKKYLINFITNPGTLTSLLLFGMIALIGALHNHAHYEMTMDADSYVRQWCRASEENKKTCTSYGSDSDY